MAIIVFTHSDHSGIGRLGPMLRDFGHRLRFVRLHHGEPVPVDLDDVDGVVTCGGPQSAYDTTLPWLESELDYLRRARDADLPLVGLCLGCQLLAKAFGGEVEPLDGGIELGWHPVTLTATGQIDPVHAGVPWNSVQLHWHRDHVKTLPPGAQKLASSARTPVQAWSLGQRIYAFQYHPEIVPDDLERWASSHPEDLQEQGVTLEALRAGTEQHSLAMHRVSMRIFEQLALLVMPVDRRFAGLHKDLHH